MKKKTKAGNQKNYIAFLLDETGSMMERKAVTISGFNEFLGSMKKLPGETFFSLTTFNSNNRKPVYVNVPIDKVNKLSGETYNPNFNTPLYDAIGNMIQDVRQAGVSGQKVLFVIMTDGEENASVEFNFERIRALIEEQKKLGWEFIFLGCDMDSYAKGFSVAGQNLGVTKSVGIDPNNIKSAYLSTRSYAVSYFGGKKDDDPDGTKKI